MISQEFIVKRERILHSDLYLGSNPKANSSLVIFFQK